MSMPDEAELIVKERCQKFLIKSCEKFLLRVFPNKASMIKGKNLSPAVCLSYPRPLFSELPLELAYKNKLSEIKAQWQR